jgi:hypothetical protein
MGSTTPVLPRPGLSTIQRGHISVSRIFERTYPNSVDFQSSDVMRIQLVTQNIAIRASMSRL